MAHLSAVCQLCLFCCIYAFKVFPAGTGREKGVLPALIGRHDVEPTLILLVIFYIIMLLLQVCLLSPILWGFLSSSTSNQSVI